MPHLFQADVLAHSKPVFAFLALGTHWILHNGEWDNSFHAVIAIWLLFFGGIATAEYVSDPRITTVGAAVGVAATAAAVYFSTLVTSIILHRGFFHRLRKVSHCSPVLTKGFINPCPDTWTICRTLLKVL